MVVLNNRLKIVKSKLVFFQVLVCFAILSCKDKVRVNYQESRPNIVFIFLDDLGYGDLSIYGNDRIKTPNIDALAREGIRFTQFYANAPVCSPSRTAFITGSYPFKYGIHGVIGSKKQNEKRKQANYLDTTAPSLPQILKQDGYTTGHFGKWHMGGGRDIKDVPYPTDYGFDKSLVGFEGIGNRILDEDHFLSDMSARLGKGKIIRVPKHKITQIYVDSALAFIRKQRSRPFYVNLFPGDVHDPFKPPKDSLELYRTKARNIEEAKFFAVLKETDRQVGRFLDSLEDMGKMDNTLIVLSSDNGPTDWPRYYRNGKRPPSSQGELRGRKWSLYEGGIRVPLIAKWEGKIPENIVDSSTVGIIMDLFPTFLSSVKIDNPEKDIIDGMDLSKAFQGTQIRNDRYLYWYFPNTPEPGNLKFKSPRYAVRKGDWKLLMEPDSSNLELYNLKIDPRESKNLSSRFPKISDSLKAGLVRWKSRNVKFSYK